MHFRNIPILLFGISMKTNPRVCYSDPARAWTQLTPQQRALLSMDKPPLERLGELPLDLLRPRPPGPSAAEKSDGNANMVK